MTLHDPWPYYQMLEDGISKISRTILFHQDNAQAFGDQLSEMIICIGSEIDTNIKMLIDANNGCIIDWLKELNKRHPGLENIELIIQHSEIRVTPFRGISLDPIESPKWWREYNKIKHNRYENRKMATVMNLLESVGGLFIINSLIGSRIKKLRPITQSIIFGNPSALLASYGAFSGVPDIGVDDKYAGCYHRYGNAAT